MKTLFALLSLSFLSNAAFAGGIICTRTTGRPSLTVTLSLDPKGIVKKKTTPYILSLSGSQQPREFYGVHSVSFHPQSLYSRTQTWSDVRLATATVYRHGLPIHYKLDMARREFTIETPSSFETFPMTCEISQAE